jgi:hypothetical protein
MGTVLGVFFIVVAAGTGVFVGTRPTVMDGRWMAGRLTEGAGEGGGTVECDRAIRVGAAGAEFACVHVTAGARETFRYRMHRDGKLERKRAGRVPRGEP